MITREQVADLQPGDVVELRHDHWPEGTVISGPLHATRGRLECGPAVVVWSDGTLQSAYDVTVVSRAPRLLYVNHPRTEPVPGDVAKDAEGLEPSGHTWHYLGDEKLAHWWRFDDRMRDSPPKRLRLLVDGETGQVVP